MPLSRGNINHKNILDAPGVDIHQSTGTGFLYSVPINPYGQMTALSFRYKLRIGTHAQGVLR